MTGMVEFLGFNEFNMPLKDFDLNYLIKLFYAIENDHKKFEQMISISSDKAEKIVKNALLSLK